MDLAADQQKKRILFIGWGKPQFKELLKLADSLSHRPGVEILFMELYNSPDHFCDLQECLRRGYKVIDNKTEPIRQKKANFVKIFAHFFGPLFYYILNFQALIHRRFGGFGIHQKLAILLAPISQLLANVAIVFYVLFYPLIYLWRKIVFFSTMLFWLVVSIRDVRYAREKVSEVRPDLIIVPEESIQTPIIYYTKAAKVLGVKTLVYPFCLAGTQEFAEVFYSSPNMNLSRSLLKRMFFKIFLRRWILNYRGRELVPVSGWKALFLEFNKLVPKNPWTLNTGFVDGVIADSYRTIDYLEKEGVARQDLYLTGSIDHDIISNYCIKSVEFWQNNSMLIKKPIGAAQFETNKPIIACALPPNQFGGTIPDKCGVVNYLELIDNFIAPLAPMTDKYNILISIHPSSNHQLNKRLLLERYSFVKVYQGETTQLISASDIFIASVSSTIRIALTKGIPVINYDIYNYDYEDFKNIPGVHTFFALADYKEILRDFLENGKMFHQLQTDSFNNRHLWGNLDGKAHERIYRVIQTLTQKSPQAAGSSATLAFQPEKSF